MGIDTLTTFINDKFKSWKMKVIVKQLIIDGSAILNQLYDEIAGARRRNAILGANYVSFAKHICDFFSTLKNRKVRSLGQAKLIIRFLFQGFQNSMQAGGHFSLFIMNKILRKQSKNLIYAIMKIIKQ